MTQALYETVKARDPDQKEFLQAVEEVDTVALVMCCLSDFC